MGEREMNLIVFRYPLIYMVFLPFGFVWSLEFGIKLAKTTAKTYVSRVMGFTVTMTNKWLGRPHTSGVGDAPLRTPYLNIE